MTARPTRPGLKVSLFAMIVTTVESITPTPSISSVRPSLVEEKKERKEKKEN
jgi:hypothetical protein